MEEPHVRIDRRAPIIVPPGETHAIRDLPHFTRRLSELGLDSPSGDGVLILPRNFETAENVAAFVFEDSTYSVRTLVRQSGLTPVTPSESLRTIQENAAEWIVPVIHFSYLAFEGSATLAALSDLFNRIRRYGAHRLGSEKMTANIAIVVSEPDGRSFELDYSGPSDGLGAVVAIASEELRRRKGLAK